MTRTVMHNYTLVARVVDEHNFSIERSFTGLLFPDPFDPNWMVTTILENQPKGTN